MDEPAVDPEEAAARALIASIGRKVADGSYLDEKHPELRRSCWLGNTPIDLEGGEAGPPSPAAPLN